MSASVAFRTKAKTLVGCVLMLALAGCTTLESTSGMRERQICKMNPGLCVDGQLRAQRLSPVIIVPGILQLPDLTVNSVGCDPVFGEVWVGAHIENQGPVPLPTLASNPSTPQQVDVLATLFPGTSGAIVLPLNSLVPPAPRAGQAYFKVAIIPDASPANMPLTLFQIYVNPPEPGAPTGQFAESNLQNNANCGVCSCSGGQCSAVQTPTCTAGP
jgi:hypothetical protein